MTSSMHPIEAAAESGAAAPSLDVVDVKLEAETSSFMETNQNTQQQQQQQQLAAFTQCSQHALISNAHET